MKKLKKGMCIIMSAAMVLSFSSCMKEASSADLENLFDNESKISYCTTYDELSSKKTNKTKTWRQGMISGNGLQGVITSGSPYSDTLIYQNMHFILPNEITRSCPDTSDELETVKQSIVEGKDITDNANYDEVYYFHPGGQLRLDQKKLSAKDYIRYTNYETAEVGVKYTDKNGTWNRETFTSKADGATITKIASSDTGSKVNMTLSLDDISTMANYQDGNEKDLKYKKVVSDDCSYIAMVAHYPNYENSELKNGGYATLSYVVVEGGTKEKISGKSVDDAEYVSNDNPEIKISNADNVYLITISDRTDSMGSIDDFAGAEKYELLDSLEKETKAVADKYTENSLFNYDSALESHLKIYQPQYDAVTISLDDGDSTESNETLIKSAKKSKEINSSLAERAYYAGRYAYLCAAGYSTTRLYGMWTGEWNAGWGSKYTMDANVNLQTSSMNTSNLTSAPVGYANFILRQAKDWEENATATHGFTDAIQAPVNTDGDCAVITETCYSYPFRYWNAGTSWMIQPLYETLKTYGDIQIPLSDEFNLEDLKSVLSTTADDLTDEDIKNIEEKGYLDLEEDILLPLLTKGANYWSQLMTTEYYTDVNGDIHYEKGKTSLENGETYCILPSYSPENNPENYSSPSDANCAIDIAACRSNLDMLMDVMGEVAPNEDTSKWQDLKNNLPPYLYDETGALKEWDCNQFTENNEHRHLSHLYCVWPLDETQNDEKLKAACEQAVKNRASENSASHALIHRSLIAARLKDRDSLTEALTGLMNSKIYYNSLMTNHNFNGRSCYCTDFELGYLGIVNESLVYSTTGEIEVLPALATNGFDSGEITGLRSQTRAVVTSLKWNVDKKTASVVITSDIDQTIKVSCGLSNEEKDVTLKAGESATVDFTLNA